MRRSFTMEYWQDDGWFVGRLRGIPGVFSQGETLADLEANLQEVLQLMLEDEVDAVPAERESREVELDVL
jgi:predicted RNase H-like HicB family nuclease